MKETEKIIELVCDLCGESMDFTGEVVNEFPNKKYMHRCRKCGHLQAALDPYPKMRNVEAL